MNKHNEAIKYDDFQRYLVSFNGNILAIAHSSWLVLVNVLTYTNDNSNVTSQQVDLTGDSYILLEFDEQLYEIYALCWLPESIIAVGFQSGIMLCFNKRGDQLFCGRISETSPIRSIRFNYNSVYGYDKEVWALLEDGHLLAVFFKHVIIFDTIFFYTTPVYLPRSRCNHWFAGDW